MPAQLKQPLYFDYHATTPCAPEAVEAIAPHAGARIETAAR